MNNTNNLFLSHDISSQATLLANHNLLLSTTKAFHVAHSPAL